jgi:hypothetical protein
MAKPRVELDYHAVYWRTVALVFFVSQLAASLLMARRGRRGRRFLFFVRFSLPSLVFGLVAATLVTLVAGLVVRLIVRPLVARWHSPPIDESQGAFHLAPSEWVVQSCPARRSMGWRWPSGTLIRTNVRLWFFPRAHDDEVWSCPLNALRDVRLEPAPRVAWGLVRNWPDRVFIRSGDDTPALFAVPEPDEVVAWLEPASPPPLLTPARI